MRRYRIHRVHELRKSVRLCLSEHLVVSVPDAPSGQLGIDNHGDSGRQIHDSWPCRDICYVNNSCSDCDWKNSSGMGPVWWYRVHGIHDLRQLFVLRLQQPVVVPMPARCRRGWLFNPSGGYQREDSDAVGTMRRNRIHWPEDVCQSILLCLQ